MASRVPRPGDISGPAGRERAARTSLHVLARRDFGLYWTGNLLSNCGTWFQNIAAALLVYRLTHSSFLVGVANFAQFAGVVLLAPWAGPAADRFDRKRLLMATQLAATVITASLAALVASGRGTVLVVVVLSLLLGLSTAFATPAMQSILPALVPREDLGAAVAMNAVTFNLSRAVGPVLGALVVQRLGVAWAVGLNALSYVFFLVVLLVISPRERVERAPGRPRLRDSIRMVRERRHLALLLAVVAAVSVTMDPVNTVTPAFATTIFHRPDTFAGVLIGAFGAGAVAASLFPARAGEHQDRTIALRLSLMGAGMIVFALAPAVGVALPALAAAGFGYLSGQTRATTRLQLEVDDRERGRVMALWSVCFLGSRPIASLLDGGLASLVGPRAATIAMVLPVFAAALLLFREPGRPAIEA